MRSYQIDAALHVLAELDPATWLQIGELSQRHKAGALSEAAWQCATGALLERVAHRVEQR